jgi:hypothetical protein
VASKAKPSKPKKRYGTSISYRDSEAATTTFTVLQKITGRKQGKSCKKPSKSNKHRKPCTLYVTMGSFSHTDLAGVNTLHFSGRLKGKKLPSGSYRLRVVPRNAAGTGATVVASFTIK